MYSSIARTLLTDSRDTNTPWRGAMRTRPRAASCCSASRTGVRETSKRAASARSSSAAPGPELAAFDLVLQRGPDVGGAAARVGALRPGFAAVGRDDGQGGVGRSSFMCYLGGEYTTYSLWYARRNFEVRVTSVRVV